jgi:hypothetical protein
MLGDLAWQVVDGPRCCLRSAGREAWVRRLPSPFVQFEEQPGEDGGIHKDPGENDHGGQHNAGSSFLCPLLY